MRLSRLSPVHRYVAAITACGAGLLALTLLRTNLRGLLRLDARLWIFVGLLVVGEFIAIKVPRRGEEGDEITTSTTFAFALLLYAGTGPAVLAQTAACIVSDIRRGKALWKVGFNVSQLVITVAASGGVLTLLTDLPHRDGAVTAGDLPGILAAGAAFFFANNALMGIGLSMATGERILGYLRRDLAFQAAPASVLLALSPVVTFLAAHSLLFLPLLAMPMAAVYRSAQVSLDFSRSEQRFRSLVQNAADVIAIVDRDATIEYQSPSVEPILGYRAGELTGTSFFDLLHDDDVQRVRVAIEDALLVHGRTVKGEFRARAADGGWRQIEAMWTNLVDHPAVRGIVVNSRDITERKELEDQLAHQAFHDSLTGLANRSLFEDRVRHALERCRRSKAPLGVIFLDLDNFKTINDSLGHAAGDELLVVAARRLRECVRPSDTPARLGGDEFAILLEDIEDEAEVNGIACRILKAITAPIHVRGRDVFTSASIGIVMSPSGRESADELLRNADVAMYTAKAAGKGRFELFRPSMYQAVLAQLELGADLKGAVERDEFTLRYQPTIDLATGKIAGVEALIRWRHPQRGLVRPAEFIVLAEETGLIIPLGRWVLTEACRQAAEWSALRPDAPLSVSVNLSPRQLQEPDLVEEVASALERSGLDPRCLVLEITESVMMRDVSHTIGVLRALKELGVRIAIDDFGTGYSSLSYLRDLPVDIMKVDKSFVDGVENGSQAAALAAAIVGLGRTLKLTTIAEGIERRPQLDQLRAMGCDLGQGYVFAPAVTPDEIRAMLVRRETNRELLACSA